MMIPRTRPTARQAEPEKPEPAKPEPTPEPAKEKTKLEEAQEERAKMDATVESLKKENDRTEQLQSDAILAGKGEIQKEQSEDDKWAKEAKERYAGTGMDPTPDDTETKYS